MLNQARNLVGEISTDLRRGDSGAVEPHSFFYTSIGKRYMPWRGDRLLVSIVSIVRLPNMNSEEMENVLKDQTICRIAFKGDEFPYISPFQYVYMNNTLYFHFTDYGRKMKFIEENKGVCVEIERYKPDLSEFSFVVLRGALKVVQDRNERSKAIWKMADEGSKKLSVNFLAAHGIRKEEGWSSLAPERQIVIVRLEETSERMGLRSP